MVGEIKRKFWLSSRFHSHSRYTWHSDPPPVFLAALTCLSLFSTKKRLCDYWRCSPRAGNAGSRPPEKDDGTLCAAKCALLRARLFEICPLYP